MAQLIQRIDDATLSLKPQKRSLTLWKPVQYGAVTEVDALIDSLNLAQVSDDGALTQMIDGLITAVPSN